MKWTPNLTVTPAASLALSAWCAPAFAQEPTRTQLSYGAEIALGSGHADRGLVVSDRPVVQPVTWVSGSVATFSVWSSFTLGRTTDGSRPQILEMELTRQHKWGRFTASPAVTMFRYRDPLAFQDSRSVEGWLHLSCSLGPLRLFTSHSMDVLTYRGAYFGEAGIGFGRRVSRRIEIGGSSRIGWASSSFNDAYVGVRRSALNRLAVDGWLKAKLTPHLQIGPQLEFSATLDHALRAELSRPTYVFVGLTTGVEF